MSRTMWILLALIAALQLRRYGPKTYRPPLTLNAKNLVEQMLTGMCTPRSTVETTTS